MPAAQIIHAPDFEALSGAAQEVLGQLFVHGPTWDGHVASKAGRDELRAADLIERWQGWQWLTAKGVALAVDDGTRQRVKHWNNPAWYKKACA